VRWDIARNLEWSLNPERVFEVLLLLLLYTWLFGWFVREWWLTQVVRRVARWRARGRGGSSQPGA
jgi:hypothetical protein